MSIATELADALEDGWLENVDLDRVDVDKLQAELRRLERVNAELVAAPQWVRGYISRYDPPGLPNHVAQRIDAALTSATKEQQK